MYDKHETIESKDFLSIYRKYKDFTEDSDKNKPNQQNRDEIFIEYLYPVIEDLLCLIQIFPLKELMDKMEQNIIISALNRFGGNQRKTARFLHIKPSTLCEKLKKHKISFKKIPYKD
jgi:DNA-binding NtrC family response regulator